MHYTCPVCFYKLLDEPPADYNICDCCGTEFGSDDETRSHAELRDFWISKGARWFFREPPPVWNPWQQLADAGVRLPYGAFVTYYNSHLTQPYHFSRQTHHHYFSTQAQPYYFAAPYGQPTSLGGIVTVDYVVTPIILADSPSIVVSQDENRMPMGMAA
jgi:hypothetical protein